MKTITFEKPSPCEVFIGSEKGVFTQLADKVKNAKTVAIITDNSVFKFYKDFLDEFLPEKKVFKFVLPAGEGAKSVDQYLEIMTFLSDKGFTRNDYLIAFGGGTVSDVAGLVAATYMRGVKYITVPTTVLSIIDASVGGKTAIDYNGIKNLIGAFYAPECVISYLPFIKTLALSEVKSGMGELIKYYFLSGGIDKDDLTLPLGEKVVLKALEIKRSIVEADDKDLGIRRLLNLGHTFGHAIETLSGFKLSHGECVVKGIYLTLKASKALYAISDESFNDAVETLTAAGFDINCPYKLKDIQKALLHDKKYDGEKLNFVAFDSCLKPTIVKITVDGLIDSVK